MSTFITLPSGLRINTAHILEYRESSPGKLVITQNVVLKDPNGYGTLEFLHEDMTAEQLDDLLRGPAIVDPVVDLDRIEPGCACCFTKNGERLFGVLKELYHYSGSKGICAIAVSDGQEFDVPIQ